MKKDLKNKKKEAIANVFFRFSHRDEEGMILTNKNEKTIVKNLHEQLTKTIEDCPESEISSSFVPFYDSILDESNKN